MLHDNIKADFINGLDPNILMILYGLSLIHLDDAIVKAKMVELGQKQVANITVQNAQVAWIQQ